MMRGMFFVFLASVAHAQEADDSAALVQQTMVPHHHHHHHRRNSNKGPIHKNEKTMVGALVRKDHGDDGPCVDNATWTDPDWHETCEQWSQYKCEGVELKKQCPKACKQCGDEALGGGGGAPADGGGGGGAEPATPKDWVDAHNKFRCMHGVPLLTWNEVIAKKAQAWANETGDNMEHSSSEYRSNVAGFSYLGENLFWSSPTMSAQKGVESWYSEIKDTDGGLATEATSKTGHYTQVVWSDSTDVGCGQNKGLSVCIYGPGGNFGHSKDYTANVKAPEKEENECTQ